MPPRPLEPLAKRLLKGLIAVELLGGLAAYALFHQMNSNFRSTMKRRFPSVLEVYYQSNEWAGLHGLREKDHDAWALKQE
ncbi:protein CEBPZOS-like isoform 2-T2 [Spinachia spinachia]